MRTLRTLIVVFLGGLLAVAAPVPLRADDEPGKLNVKVVGPDRKSTGDGKVDQVVIGGGEGGAKAGTVGKGRVVLITASDTFNKYDGRAGRKHQGAFYVPDGTEVEMIATVRPYIDPKFAYEWAVASAKEGYMEMYQGAYDALKNEVSDLERLDRDVQTAIDAWADVNEVPKLPLKDIDKQLKIARAVGADRRDNAAIAKLESYRSMLVDRDKMRAELKVFQDLLASLKPPEKKTVMLPSACNDEQMLADIGAAGGNAPADCSAIVSVANIALPLTQPIRSLSNLQEVVFYEATMGTNTIEYATDAPDLMTRRADPLGDGNADFTFYEGEYYDVFYSDANGSPDVDGSYLTVEGVWRYDGWHLGGMNIAEVELRFEDKSVDLGDFVTNAVFGSVCDPSYNLNCVAGSELAAADNNKQTIPRFGQTSLTNLNERFRLTIGFYHTEKM